MATKKLPIYFEDYLNEKFKRVFSEIGDVKSEITGIRTQLTVLNGTARSNKMKISLLGTRMKLVWISLTVFAILFAFHEANPNSNVFASILQTFRGF
jgi:hypothetical protein